jgi:hypothetical protein
LNGGKAQVRLRWVATKRRWSGSAVMPLYLLTVFGKNVKANLTKSGRNDMAKLVAVLKLNVERQQ